MQNKSQLRCIMSIIAGVFGVLGGIGSIGVIFFMRFMLTSPEFGSPADSDEILNIMAIVYGIMGAVLLLLGIIGITGGIFALKKRMWGMALAGAICGIITFLPLGIVSTVFISQAHKEFGWSNLSTPPAGEPAPNP
jgi:hypothetical protein